ncbi:putative permease [Actinoplanes missouriensis 431]|uniref:Putative permease n=1 Tax=Actinoplanes missouriensis (strain ATCC 14538 / DSM 43046 / CBS 188.64 / JCM 3121 / NBRC 102363 / NCIMB 12654 / NRRL B-3342 / UNCC 431) TaxID=512565 RepID=I0HFD0_ACTM4|nr:FtsX-like permease family protein [Actinoplanes missouriensis]BAL91717.1 putative permease [Actinoplanes missouriensis 431]
MISVLLAMIWSRRGQAVTLAVLALIAVASAVAAPAYLLAVERAVAQGQIETAELDELRLVIRAANDYQVAAQSGEVVRITAAGNALDRMTGFSFVYSEEMPTLGLESTNSYASRLVFRQDVCDHLVILTGRCVSGEGDVLLGEQSAKRLKVGAGDTFVLRTARVDGRSQPPFWQPEGDPKTFTVAGTYRVPDPSEIYWGTHGYFISGPFIGPGEPLFTTDTSLNSIVRSTSLEAIDGIAAPGTLHIDRLDAVRAELAELESVTDAVPGLNLDTGIPQLFERIESGRAEARLLVPVLAVPLVLLACFSIYLTVGHGAEGRRDEIAVVALRGARWWTRWWLATGESLTAVLAGALAGCVAGQLLVNLVAASIFQGAGADPALSSLRYAPAATGTALAAALLAQRRPLFSPVSALLQRTTGGRRPIPVIEAVVVVLAVVAAAQLYLADGSLDGLGSFAPALLMLALALLTARAVLPLVSRYAGRALQRGRLGAGLAGLQLSRRPGAGRLFALLAASAAVAGYATCAVDTAAQVRDVEARLGTGAHRVITLERMPRRQLLDAVRRADPEGRFAMAVAELPTGGSAGVPGLAVDSARLPAVAYWTDSGPSAAEVAARLHPSAPERPSFTGDEIVAEVTTTEVASDRRLRLAIALSSKIGLGETVVEIGVLRNGPARYRQPLSFCAKGCWVNGIGISGLGRATETTGTIEVRGLNGISFGGWWAAQNAQVTNSPTLTVKANVRAAPSGTAWIRPPATADPLPLAVAGAGPPAGVLTSLGGDAIPAAAIARLPVVPMAGRNAVLMDLDLADRLAVDAQPAQAPQVWLGPDAPADVLQRLADEGLVASGDTSAAQVRERLDRQGPALALTFHVLAGILAALLGAGALVLTIAVDRGRRAGDLAALRAQGLPGRVVRRATLWTYPVLVGFAVLVGLLVGAATWWLTGWSLPLAGLTPPDLPAPGTPRPAILLAVAAAVLALFVAVALAGGRDLRKRTEKGPE